MTTIQALRLVYCLVVTVAFLVAWRKNLFSGKRQAVVAWSLIGLLAIFVGARPLLPRTDTAMYHYIFSGACEGGVSWLGVRFARIGYDPLFGVLLYLCSLTRSFHFAITLVSFLTLAATWFGARLYTSGERVGSALMLFLLTIVNFTFLNQQDNVIRCGLAFPLLLIYYYSLFRDDRRRAILFGVLAVGVHFSMVAGVLAALVARFVRCRLRWYYLFFAAVLVASAAGIGIQWIVGHLDFWKAEYYSSLMATATYRTGFRPDFAAFNTAFLIFFAWLCHKAPSAFMAFCIRLFVLLSCWFFMWFAIPYSDRVGAFSWNILPAMAYIGSIRAFPGRRNIIVPALFAAFLLMTLVIFVNHTFRPQ